MGIMFTKKYNQILVLYRILSRAYFYLPVFIIYLCSTGMNIFHISLCMSVYCISSLITNELFNLIKHRYQCKYLLIFGELLKITGLLILIVNGYENIYYIIISQIILGGGYIISAGHDSTIIYSNIHNPTAFQEKTNGYMFYSLLISGIIGYFCFQINNKIPFILSIITSSILIVAILICLPDKDYPAKKNNNTRKNIDKYKVFLDYSFTRGIILGAFTTFIPYHLYIDLKTNTYYFILILSSYTISGFISSKYLSKYLLDRKLFINILLLISIFGFYFDNIFPEIISMLIFGVISGTSRPTCLNKLKKLRLNISHENISLERFYSLVNVFFLCVGGYIYLNYGFKYIILLSYIMMITYYIIYLILSKKYQTTNNLTSPQYR
ncbi:MAG: hypothetical protein CENE_00733 [Candidatus Celerinatantimonas neptuna]|nr:MAG: hypothetical protein CENE_00733 [Candidatus Celerinatantimonas neptuna]